MGNAYAVKWQAFEGPILLWEHESVDGLPIGGHPPSTVVEFGAPGLVENSEHRFRVAFYDAWGKWTCWSSFRNNVNTTPFSGIAPDAPSNTTVMVEDEFRRPETSYDLSGGDGIGPEAVWNTEFQTKIDADEQMVLMVPTEVIASGAIFGTIAPPHAYAEAYFVNDVSSNTKYNVDVSARGFVDENDNNYQKLFFLKLENDIEPDGKPRLRIGRTVNTNPSYLLNKKLEDIDGCPTTIPLENENGQTGRSDPVWLRIEVDDDDIHDHAIVTGTVAWNCTSGGIGDCGASCEITFEDTGDPAGMYNKSGALGFDSHHKVHYLDRFRAGWESSQ